MSLECGNHNWEDTESHDWESEHEEGDAGYDDAWGSGSDSDLEPMPKESPAEQLLGVLLSLLFASDISAGTFCVICHFVALCGVETLRPYGLAPGKQSGKYNRHLKEVLGEGDWSKSLHCIHVAGHRRHDLSRSWYKLDVAVPHSMVDEEVSAAGGAFRVKLDEAIADRELPETYYDHPLVQQSDQPVLPVALYMDAVPYSQTDSVIGFWFVNLISGMRHLFLVMRKRMCCRCGCRGWCSFFPVFKYIHACCHAMA